MPYIMVMGSLSAPHLSKDEGATVYGLKSEERASLVRQGEGPIIKSTGCYRSYLADPKFSKIFRSMYAHVSELNSSFGMSVAMTNETERTVRVTQKGLTLVVVNRIHGLLGYDVVSHAMAMTNANRELISFTMYKKTGANSHGKSHGQAHGQSQAHGHGHSSSHKSHTHSSLVTL